MNYNNKIQAFQQQQQNLEENVSEKMNKVSTKLQKKTKF
jgi:hypothetical protein